MEQNHRTVIILGAGPAGYTAAIYAARANLNPMVIAGPQKGGQLTTTTEVENFPGFSKGIDGNVLMNEMERQALRFGAEIVFGVVTEVDVAGRPFTVTAGSRVHTCDAMIVATGASARYLGLESEDRFKNRGVSTCAACDGFSFTGRTVAVIGGGDSALEEAGYLANICEKVFLVHRRDEFRGSRVLRERVLKHERIEAVWDSVVEEVIGDDEDGVTDLAVKNVKTGEVRRLGAAGMFVAIGHDPNTGIFRGKLEMDVRNHLLTRSGSTQTGVDGVFACGDVADGIYRQAVTAASAGCMAAIDAERWLAGR